MKERPVAAVTRATPFWKHPAVVPVFVAFVALIVAEVTGITASLNRALSDTHARWHVAATRPAYPESLLIVGIDDASVRRFGRMKNWSRARYASLLDKTRTAKVVGVDILFTEPDERDPDGDAALADAVKRAGNVVLPAFVYNEVRPVSTETQTQTAAFVARLPDADAAAADSFPTINPQTVEPPLPALVAGARMLSQVSVNADPDNVYRRPVVAFVTPDANGKLRYVPHITAAVASVATGKSVGELLDGLPLESGAVVLRSVTRRSGSLRQSVGVAAPYLSLVDALDKSSDFFRGKTVLLGETTTGTADVRPNALDNGLRGVELNAEIVANLTGAFAPLRDLPVWAAFVLVAASVGLPAWAFATFRQTNTAAVAAGVVMFGAVAVCETAYFAGGMVPPWASVLTGFTTATLAAGIGRAGTESARRLQIEEQFSAYVAPEQVAELSRNPDALFAGTRRTRCAVLFSDIRAFTTYSEANPPDVVDRQMREYLTEMSAAVFARLHFLDKFIGDAVMALFGDLFPGAQSRESDAAEAVLCAVEMLNRLDALNLRWTYDNLPRFKIGIGIHCGEVLFGNVGAADAGAGIRRVQLTALGDTVNIASRLQTATKEYGVTILVSGAVKDEAEKSPLLSLVTWRDLGEITVRGREKGTPIWAVERMLFAEGTK